MERAILAIPVAYFFLKFLNGYGPFDIVPESLHLLPGLFLAVFITSLSIS